MGLNDTPSGERLHIGFFGRRNAGKSSLVNAVTQQETAIVSSEKGTTTDPVFKAMELLPLGPVMLIDTPGFDDDAGTLGRLRVKKTRQILNKTDIAVLVIDSNTGITPSDEELLALFREKAIPFLIAWNKCDKRNVWPKPSVENEILVSAAKKSGIEELKEQLARLVPAEKNRTFIRDMLSPGDLVLLIIPIDKAAPKGRLILPQQQAIRDILEANALPIVCRESETAIALENLKKPPVLAVCDSQIFKKAAASVPSAIPLTSFSILMARYKGFLNEAVEGAAALAHLKNGDRILIAEGCTHHRQCNDIGTVKIPHWLKEYTGKQLHIETSSGHTFPDELGNYHLIVHCGGCMLNQREMMYRMKCAKDQGVPMTNYGTLIAHLHGILERSLGLFPHLAAKVREKT